MKKQLPKSAINKNEISCSGAKNLKVLRDQIHIQKLISN